MAEDYDYAAKEMYARRIANSTQPLQQPDSPADRNATKCTIDYPKPDPSRFGIRSAHQLDAEGSRYSTAGIRYALCRAGEFLRNLHDNRLTAQRRYNLFDHKALP